MRSPAPLSALLTAPAFRMTDRGAWRANRTLSIATTDMVLNMSLVDVAPDVWEADETDLQERIS